MEKKYPRDDGWNREHALMQKQKKMLYQKICEYISQEQWEIAYLLACTEKYSEQYNQIQKKLDDIFVHQNNPDSIPQLHQKITLINTIQDSLILALQPLFNQLYTKIADETDGWLWYNEELRTDVRLDLIMGERNISWSMDGSRNHYRYSYIDKLKEISSKKVKKPEQKSLPIPREHKLITEENYEAMSEILIQNMERIIQEYSQNFQFDSKNVDIYKQFIEKYFLYIFIKALIESKYVLDMRSSKWSICLDKTLEEIRIYFENFIKKKLDIDPKYIKAKLWTNTNNITIDPMDLSYKNASFEDMEQWEHYLNQTYFVPKWISINDIRVQIMQEYNSQEGMQERYRDMLNPWYHIYKEHEENHKKHLEILMDYQKKSSDQDPYIQEIIKDIQEKLWFASQKKKEHTIFEENTPKILPKYEKSLTQIQKQYMKRYQVPIQYWQIFAVVFNKLNNYYQIKIRLLKDADKINHQTFDNFANSDRMNKDFYYAFQNYRTYEHINKTFAEKWTKKQLDRWVELQQKFKKIQKPLKKKDTENPSQLGLEF